MWKMIRLVLLAVLVVAAGVALLAVRYARLSKYKETVPAVHEEGAPVFLPNEDFSLAASAVVDGEGVLHIPDNTVISGSQACTVVARHGKFTIPSRWAGNVAIKTIRTLEDAAEKYVVQFFEKDSYTQYRTQEYVNADNASVMGKLTELTYVNTDSGRAALEENPRQMPVVSWKDVGSIGSWYLLQLDQSSGTADEVHALIMSYLLDADYAGCIISSLMEYGDNMYYPDEAVRKIAESYQDDGMGPEVPDGYKAAAVASAIPYAESTEVPSMPAVESTPQSYNWGPAVWPWKYPDAGISYPYGAQESGGSVAPNLTPGIVGGTDGEVQPQDTGTAIQETEPYIEEQAGMGGQMTVDEDTAVIIDE